MPVYIYECKQCGIEVEAVQSIEAGAPKCETCGVGMTKKPTHPAIIKVVGQGGYPTRSKGYKEGYSKEYLKSLTPRTQ